MGYTIYWTLCATTEEKIEQFKKLITPHVPAKYVTDVFDFSSLSCVYYKPRNDTDAKNVKRCLILLGAMGIASSFFSDHGYDDFHKELAFIDKNVSGIHHSNIDMVKAMLMIHEIESIVTDEPVADVLDIETLYPSINQCLTHMCDMLPALQNAPNDDE